MAVTITVRTDGPYLVEGEIELRDADGNAIPMTPGKPVKLCRCGASSRKPFCDGTHSKIGFRGAEQAAREFDAGR
jgi:CDGSH-type Zn-finger protein